MDVVFEARADPTRRALLDALFRQDGQTLAALAEPFVMTRIAVAKHLGVLEAAGLVRARRRGREKHHPMNPVPIREIHDRWVSKCTEPWAAGLVSLKHDLETAMDDLSETAPEMEKVFEIYIRSTPEQLWAAITDPDVRARCHFGNRVESDWSTGSTYVVTNPRADGPIIDEANLEVSPPSRLVQSMRAWWDDDELAANTSRVTWEIEPVCDTCRLTVTHDQLPAGADEQLYGRVADDHLRPQDLDRGGGGADHPGSLMFS